MGKIKLTESQIEMLQSFEKQLPKKKIVKLTTEQYSRIFESDNGFEFDMPPKAIRPSTKITKDFKSGSRDIPDSNIRFEGDTNSAKPISVEEFGKNIISFFKGLLTDPNDDNTSKFWRDLDITKQQLTDRMFELGMIGHGVINGKKILKVMKNNFMENIKVLYNEYIPQNEGLTQMGGDIELDETNHDEMKQNILKQLKPKEGPKPSPEAIKAKIAARRAEELKRREAENNKPIGENDGYPMGTAHDPDSPWNRVDPDNARRPKESPFNLVVYYNEYAFFEKGGKYYIFNVEGTDKDDYAQYADREEMFNGYDEDGMADVDFGEWELDDSVIDNYVNDNYKHLSYGKGLDDWENGLDMVEIDQSLLDEMISVVKYIKDPKLQEKVTSILKNISVSEVTSAASSGAFVGKMGTNVPITGVSPADEMKKVVGEVEDYDDIDAKLDNLKYKNFQHPALGTFHIDKVHQKDEDDNKVTYSIKLNREGGPSSSELYYSYDKTTGKDGLIFNHESEIIRNAYEMFDELYSLVFDGVKDALRPTEDVQESGGGVANSGQYATPGFASSEFFGNKGKKGKAPVNKGITHTKTMYPKGKMVKVTESQMLMIKKLIIESDNQKDTAYPDGGFVKLDNCTKLNNNKEAQNGGCSVGAKDNVVKLKQTKDSVVSDDAVYSEVAKKTGRTIAEVKKIIQSRKG